MNEPLDVSVDATGIARLTINRPSRANAFDRALIAGLHDVLQLLANDKTLRLLILAGAGRNFSAGLDLKAVSDRTGASAETDYADSLRLSKLLQSLNTMPVPVMALVSGAAIGLGAGLVACCDVVLAADTATFRFSEVRLGIIPATISPFVAAAIGARACRRYFLTGESFSAAEAHRLGLVHEICPPQTMEARAAALGSELLAGKPLAQRAAKRLIEDVRLAPQGEALGEETARRLAELRGGPEAQAAIAEFLAR